MYKKNLTFFHEYYFITNHINYNNNLLLKLFLTINGFKYNQLILKVKRITRIKHTHWKQIRFFLYRKNITKYSNLHIMQGQTVPWLMVTCNILFMSVNSSNEWSPNRTHLNKWLIRRWKIILTLNCLNIFYKIKN